MLSRAADAHLVHALLVRVLLGVSTGATIAARQPPGWFRIYRAGSLGAVSGGFLLGRMKQKRQGQDGGEQQGHSDHGLLPLISIPQISTLLYTSAGDHGRSTRPAAPPAERHIRLVRPDSRLCLDYFLCVCLVSSLE